MIGWGTVAGVVARIVDTLWPSKKAAIIDKLNSLNFKYNDALINRRDTEAAKIKKEMDALRKKVNFTDGEI